MEKIYDDIEEVLIPQNVLQKRIEELGAQITKDLEGEEVVVIGVLKGCVIFLSDIFRHLDMKCDLDFMVCSSYENATESSGNVKIIKDINVDVKNKVVLVVEDIIDSDSMYQISLLLDTDLIMPENIEIFRKFAY